MAQRTEDVHHEKEDECEGGQSDSTPYDGSEDLHI
jgi:hypothetical protein